MSAFLDTNVVVRYLTGRPLEAAEEAARIIDGLEDLQITDVALTETAYVLQSVYGVARERIVDGLIDLLQKDNISPFGLDRDLVLQGLLLCRPSGRISFADAMIWAGARSAGVRVVYSFDERFPGDGLDVRRRA